MIRPKIVVTRSLPPAWIARLDDVGDVWLPPEHRALAREDLIAAVDGATAIVAMLNDRIDQAVIDAAGPQLQIVANCAAGYDNLDVISLTAAGVTATNTPGVLIDATADLAIGLMLDVSRRISEGDRMIRTGHSWAWDMTFHLGASIRGKQLGIVGMGAIGAATAARAAAFGMSIAYTSRTEKTGPGVRLSLPELLKTSDVVSLHCPLTTATRHLIDRAALRSMQATALLVNTARGPIIDELALVDALERGVIAGAALDVFEFEPAVSESLRTLPNVVLTPHLGSATTETRAQMAELAVSNVVAVLGGGAPLSPIHNR